MKIIDIAKNIDKSKENECWVDIQELAHEFDLYINCIDQEKLKSYWIGNWYCTDTYVGYRIYFLDDEPVCISSQRGRKWDEEFHWFSEKVAEKTKKYLATLVLEKDEKLDIEICDINEDIGNSYKIDFNANVLDWSKATLNGESVKFIERIRSEKDYGIDQEVKVELNTGEQKIINIHDLDFKFNLKE